MEWGDGFQLPVKSGNPMSSEGIKESAWNYVN